jgi:hypothetical protein
MKALTLTQPWATLVAIGAKKIETRSWATKYRGSLAIHAAVDKRFINIRSKDYICHLEPFYTILTEYTQKLAISYQDLRDMVHRPPLPTGMIVATCKLVSVEKLEYDHQYGWQKGNRGWIMTPQEIAFGDYTLGRYVWLIADINPLPEPIPAKGSLGLWEWQS